MDNLSSVYETHLKKLPLVQKGKVRDIYGVDTDHLLIITTDRLSAFDVILPDPVPNKGRILTEISNFWFQKTEHLISNHLVKADLAEILGDEPDKEDLIKRSAYRSGCSWLFNWIRLEGLLSNWQCLRNTLS